MGKGDNPPNLPEETVVKTLSATDALTILFLSAGALAANNQPVTLSADTSTPNMTVIAKNQAWPLKGLITVESCRTIRCIAV